jgi:hypothetical protein
MDETVDMGMRWVELNRGMSAICPGDHEPGLNVLVPDGV